LMGSAKSSVVNANAAQSNSAFTVRDLGSIDGIINWGEYCGGVIARELNIDVSDSAVPFP